MSNGFQLGLKIAAIRCEENVEFSGFERVSNGQEE
jgi:hypothetical protein